MLVFSDVTGVRQVRLVAERLCVRLPAESWWGVFDSQPNSVMKFDYLAERLYVHLRSERQGVKLQAKRLYVQLPAKGMTVSTPS